MGSPDDLGWRDVSASRCCVLGDAVALGVGDVDSLSRRPPRGSRPDANPSAPRKLVPGPGTLPDHTKGAAVESWRMEGAEAAPCRRKCTTSSCESVSLQRRDGTGPVCSQNGGGLPVRVDAPRFIQMLADGGDEVAYRRQRRRTGGRRRHGQANDSTPRCRNEGEGASSLADHRLLLSILRASGPERTGQFLNSTVSKPIPRLAVGATGAHAE